MLSTRRVIFGLMVAAFMGASPAAPAFPTREETRILLARDCTLAAQQAVALVEEQLDRPNPRGSLWGEAGDALVRSLTGCKTDPEALFQAAQSSRYFDHQKSARQLSGNFVRFEFTTTDPEKDFYIAFNVCLHDLDGHFIKCRKTQIMGVTSFLNHPSL